MYGYYDRETVLCSRLMKLLEQEVIPSNYTRRQVSLTNQCAHFFTNKFINNWNSLSPNTVLVGTLKYMGHKVI